MTRSKASVPNFSLVWVLLIAIALTGGIMSLVKAQTTTTPVAAATYATVNNQPAERPPEADNRLTMSAGIQLMSNDTYWPVSGDIGSNHGMRNGVMHDGVDIPGPEGDPIVSVRDGVVIDAGPAQGYGQWVVVRQDDGRVVEYGHVESIQASVGDRVKGGQQIATRGNRGDSSGSHLHLRVRGENPNVLLSAVTGKHVTPIPSESPADKPAPAPEIRTMTDQRPSAPAPTQEAAPAPAPQTSTPAYDDVWDRLMECEAGGDGKWAADTGNGYSGGLQFKPSTWAAYKDADAPAVAGKATREQQIRAAERVQAEQGWGAWPACTAELGITDDPVVMNAPVETAPTPIVDTPVPAETAPEVASAPESVVETLPAPAQTWVEEQVESLPEPVQAPVQEWIDAQTVPAPAPAYTAPVADMQQQFDTFVASAAPVFNANAVVDQVQTFVDNTPALASNPAIAGAVAQLPGLLGIG